MCSRQLFIYEEHRRRNIPHIAGTDLQEVRRIKQQFTDNFEMKDMGKLNYYLVMKITITDDFI